MPTEAVVIEAGRMLVDRGGTRLMRAVEAEAQARGCQQIVLDTLDFQAPQFYLKLGFEVRARVPDHIQGHDMFVMAKRLDRPRQSAQGEEPDSPAMIRAREAEW